MGIWTRRMRCWKWLHNRVDTFARWMDPPYVGVPSPLESLVTTGPWNACDWSGFGGADDSDVQRASAEYARVLQRGPDRYVWLGRGWYWKLNEWCAQRYIPAVMAADAQQRRERSARKIAEKVGG